MKRCACILLIGMFLAAGNLYAARVTNVELSHENGATVASIKLDGSIRYMHQTEVPKDGKPYRVIVDVLAATHDLGAWEFTDLPKCPVVRIRTSQYAVKPEKIVRLVFDMAGSPLYRIETDKEAIRVTFTDKNVAPFAAWSSSTSQAVTGRFSAPVTSGRPSVSAAEENTAIDRDRLASLTSAEKPRPDAAAVKGKAAGQKPSGASVKASSKTDLPSPAKASKGTAAIRPAAPVEIPEVTKVKMHDTVYGPEISARSAEIEKVQESTPAPSAGLGTRKAPAKENSTAASSRPQQLTERQKPASDTKLKTSAAQVKPEVSSSEPAKAASSTKPAATKAAHSRQEPTTPKAAAGQPAGDQKVLAKKLKGDQKGKPASREPAPGKASKATAQAPSKAVGTEAAATRSTSRFRRSTSKIKGTMVAEFPKRLVIKYHARLSRDPFEALINETKTYEGPIETRIPNVEGLKLVGIIESATEANRALLEDKTGYSYILKSGDKVKKGYVLRVEQDRVYFQIFEYGWSRTVALSLDEY
ncbi:MAG TPA: hypothetical protein VMY05_10840 [Acidobacteriota bacterium]|nr:hypothetical protein [Acidobacteriota bacterium]